MSKKKIAVLFGGQSSEHVVSCVSAANVIDQIDKEKYDLLLIGITEEGHWVKADSVEDIRSEAWRQSRVDVVISPDATKKCALITENGVTSSDIVIHEESCQIVIALCKRGCLTGNRSEEHTSELQSR